MNKDKQLIESINAGDLAEVTQLIADGADANSKHEDSEGYSNRTPLIYAAKAGRLAIVQALLAAGADHRAKDRYIMPSEGGGETALHHAIEGQHYDVVKVLIAAGANLNAKSSSETPLMAAIRLDDAKMVQLLLENGANPNAHKDGFTALGSALLDGKVAVIRTLLQMGADPNFQEPDFGTTYLMEAAEQGNAEIVRALLDAKANVNLCNRSGETALMSAAGGGDGAGNIAVMLLAAGANVDARTPSGWTALMQAANRRGRTKTVETLLRAGASKDGLDWVPVVKAVNDDKPWKRVKPLFEKVINPAIRIPAGHPLPQWGHSSDDRSALIRAMVERGADPNLGATDTDDADCLLKYAIQDEDEELVRWLIQKGANPNLITRNGKSVLANCYASKAVTKAIQDEVRGRLELKVEEEFKPPDLREASAGPEFQRTVLALARKLGCPVNSMQPRELGGVEIEVKPEVAKDLLLKRHEPLRSQNVYALATNADFTRLALLPTNSWATAVASAQTNAPNYDLTTSAIISRLQELELETPFIITAAGPDFIEGRFIAAPRSSRKVAQFLYELCPDMVDQGAGTVASSAEELKRTKRFFLWWD